ncbi:MAG TPA: PmoA family protein [Planctomycetaceae bacterium]|nr:PmoA family protein [Planctomycetaceae bacterium]
MIRPLLTALLALLVPALAAAAEGVRLEKKGDAIVVTIDGKEFTTYNTAKTQPKPYFWPVVTADGANIVRSLEKPEDHPHHKGIWCSIDEVNGIKFWAEKGKIVNVSAEVVAEAGKPPRIHAVNHWVNADGSPVLRETIDVTFFPNRLMIYDAQFTAVDKPVTFHDTKEGMFGIRMANPLRERVGGRIVNAEGLKGMKECWGKESKWVDYVGEMDGKTYGVTIFDGPNNVRKSRYHVRDYGLFSLSPFGQKAYTNDMLPADPLTLEPGKSIRLRYGLYVHNGDTTEGHVVEAYEQFLKSEAKS